MRCIYRVAPAARHCFAERNRSAWFTASQGELPGE